LYSARISSSAFFGSKRTPGYPEKSTGGKRDFPRVPVNSTPGKLTIPRVNRVFAVLPSLRGGGAGGGGAAGSAPAPVPAFRGEAIGREPASPANRYFTLQWNFSGP